MSKPCAQCPWRLSNQGKPHPHKFYSMANLRRLWNQIRKADGGDAQSCHMTDPSHPEHVAAGAKPGAKAQECPGSVIIIRRELRRMANEKGEITVEGWERYRSERAKRGLTKTGMRWWGISRACFGGVPFVGGPKLPEVDEADPEIGLPEVLREG